MPEIYFRVLRFLRINGSEGKGIWHRIRRSEFDPCIAHGRRDPTPGRCPLEDFKNMEENLSKERQGLKKNITEIVTMKESMQ